MNTLKNCIAAVLLACVLIPGTVSAMGIEASVGGWNQDPSGDLSYKQQTALDNLSIGDNLRYGDKTRIFGRVKIEMPLFFPNIYLMATPMSFRRYRKQKCHLQIRQYLLRRRHSVHFQPPARSLRYRPLLRHSRSEAGDCRYPERGRGTWRQDFRLQGRIDRLVQRSDRHGN